MRKTMNILVMTCAGLFLIVATLLKVHQMINECIPSWTENPTGFWESYEFFLIQIPLEFALGVWMVSGLFRKAAWLAGTCAYFGFIFATLSKVITGAESCGCFGQIHVDPMITLFVIDIPFFVLLAIFRPKGEKLLPPPWPNLLYILVVAVPVVGFMVLSPSAMVTFKEPCIKVEDNPVDVTAPYKLQIYQLKQQLAEYKNLQDQIQEKLETLTAQQAAMSVGKVFLSGPLKVTVSDTEWMYTVQVGEQTFEINAADLKTILVSVVDPKKQKVVLTDSGAIEIQLIEVAVPEVVENGGTESVKPMPAAEQWGWLEYVVEDDVRDALSSGMTVVLMYHHDCPTCAEMAPQYSEYYANMLAQGNDEFKIAFIAVPPYADEGPIPEDTPCIVGKLTDTQKWQVMSPYVVTLLDGELIKDWPQGTAPEPETLPDEIFKMFEGM